MENRSAFYRTGATTHDELANVISALEIYVGALEIIMAFEERGWSLYRVGNRVINCCLDIKPIVETRRAWQDLELGVRYMPLPFTKKDGDWNVVCCLIDKMNSLSRGPYFVEIEEGADEVGEKWVKILGRFWIDSIILHPTNLQLVVDPRMSEPTDPRREFPGSVIDLGGSGADAIRRQVTCSFPKR